MKPQSSFVISCHADTGFRRHRCRLERGGTVCHGHLDNFAGVKAVMDAFFSGGLDRENVRIELTYGEETDFGGARAVLRTLSKEDTVVVVDVTGAKTRADITIEKCADPETARFVREALAGMPKVAMFSGCPDPVSDSDETDVYRGRARRVFFLGIPCSGGDYNAGRVRCRMQSLTAAARALTLLAKAHFQEARAGNRDLRKRPGASGPRTGRCRLAARTAAQGRRPQRT
ncbi:MAG: hypothetical protein QUS35_01135 [bacterium]|nr:hypothetical protein [bacterium]